MKKLSLLHRQQFREGGLTYPRCFYSASKQSLPATPPATPTDLRKPLHSTPPRHQQVATHARRNQEDGTPSLPSSQPHQTYPLRGYYLEILSHPRQRTIPRLPKEKSKPEVQSQTSPPVDTRNQPPEPAPEPTPAEKMRIVFGTRLAGPGYSGSSGRYDPGGRTPESTWRVLNGVPIPPRPQEPDNCCMSGCVHCVWDDYRDEVEAWAERVREARRKGRTQKKKGKQKGKEKGMKGSISEKGSDSSVAGEMRHKPRKEVESASMSMDDDGGGSEANWDGGIGDGIGENADDLFSEIPVGIREFMKTEKRLREKKLMTRAETGTGSGEGEEPRFKGFAS
ncbi:conserved hypothetical protein [Histoplasma capsulatum G186AR]|uniref:Oxidoreductase-like domain-containing protein n=1 Tax=Ajellomyces capsulatus (strain G186AR / H82 / ATCC MYA-2454 / RMSCC 2432) TaxID=447093 RepID=C0NYQ4_AJECG|nr:uncharacterized protein HCBG_08284 [Histoplasma capsulatum G186AR]EEH03344.1 conserved hypothetical protein [Histoplasma capsulatum G186AR]